MLVVVMVVAVVAAAATVEVLEVVSSLQHSKCTSRSQESVPDSASSNRDAIRRPLNEQL